MYVNKSASLPDVHTYIHVYVCVCGGGGGGGGGLIMVYMWLADTMMSGLHGMHAYGVMKHVLI